jgi:hypothetical protein
VAQKLLDQLVMRTRPAAPDPWTADVDDGWRDLVISSAPPPPPPPAREAIEPPHMPSDMRAWQEHGAARPITVEEPNFSAGDRRLWIMAGALMAMATLVLGVLGLLTFHAAPSAEPAAEARATVEAPRAVDSARAAPARATVKVAAVNPRVLKHTASKHARKHRPIASR